MHQRKHFTLNFLSMKYFLLKSFQTTVCTYNQLLWQILACGFLTTEHLI